METLLGALLLIVIALGYGLFSLVGGIIAFMVSPIGIVLLILSCCGGCGCNRN